MKEKIIAKRYAEAFLGYVKHTVGIEQAAEEFKSLKIILSKNPDLQAFLENAQILSSEKRLAIDNILKDFSLELRNFLKLLLEKERIKNIIDIADYVRINYSYGEALDALLKTTYFLDTDMIKNIKQRLEDKFRRKLNLHIELDPDLLGGIQVIVGNTIIDGSVRRRLQDLKQQLTSIRLN